MIDFNELLEKTIISQYGTAEHLQGLLRAVLKQIDPTADIKNFCDDVFNPATAKGVGLDIWGVIVGASRYLNAENEDIFGFQGQLLKNFNEAPFVNIGETNLYRLTDEAFRRLIFVKAKANISDASLPSIKSMLRELFGVSEITAINVENIAPMKVRLIFSYYASAFEIGILKQYGLFNLGAGVDFEVYQIDPKFTFGFGGSGLQNFNNGIFQPYGIQQEL